MRFLIFIVATVMIFIALWLAKPVLVPLLLAALLAQLLVPIDERFGRHVPPLVAALSSVALMLLLVIGIVSLVGTQLSAMETDLPVIVSRVTKTLETLAADLGQYFGVAERIQKKILNLSFDTAIPASSAAAAVTALTFTIAMAAEAALVTILAFLMLYYRRHFRRQLKRLGDSVGAPSLGTAIDGTVELSQRYVAGLGIVMVIAGVADTIGLLIVGVPFAAVFGLLGALAVLIPYVGFAIVASTCAALTWLATGSFSLAGGVLVVFGIVHAIEGNVLSPILVGSRVSLNPLATIVAILVGGQLWGPLGIVLFIPMFGTLRLILAEQPATEPISRLLGPITDIDIKVRRSKAVAQALAATSGAIKLRVAKVVGRTPPPPDVEPVEPAKVPDTVSP